MEGNEGPLALLVVLLLAAPWICDAIKVLTAEQPEPIRIKEDHHDAQ